MKQRSGMHRRVIKAGGAISCGLVFLFALFGEVTDGRGGICGGSLQVHLKAFHAYESGQLVRNNDSAPLNKWMRRCSLRNLHLRMYSCIFMYTTQTQTHATVEFIRVFICVESKKNGPGVAAGPSVIR
jgi:hypothetical protein